MSVPMFGSSGAVPQNTSALEKTRSELHQYAQGLMIASVVLLISFWASYIFPFLLMVGAIVTGLLQFTHTKDYDTMMTDTTVAGPSQVFRYLHMMNICGVILGVVSQLLCVLALIINSTDGDFSSVDFIFQGVSFGASACITAIAWVSQVKCREVDIQVVAILTGTIITGGHMANASAPLVGSGGAGYGSAAQPPAQGYGVPNPNPYGAPVTGTPIHFSEHKPAGSTPV